MASEYISRLTANDSKATLLYGVPGTEKTKIAMLAACSILNIDKTRLMKYRYDPVGMCNDNGCWEIMSMHPGYDYSNFIGDMREKPAGGTGNNNFRRGIFSVMCKKAAEMRDLHGRNENSRNFVLILDSVERVNLPALFGELLPALKYRDVMVSTPFTRSISIPDNIHIIATANVASLRDLPKFSDVIRFFTPLNITPDMSRLPVLLSHYNIPEKDITCFTDKCVALNNALARIFSESIHIENAGIGQEFLARIKDYMKRPGTKEKVCNEIGSEMLETLWNEIIDPLVYESLGQNAYFRSVAKLNATKAHFLK